jgi:S1-C subfamily serine protease
MKKKLFTAFLALMMISGTAYAATAINGMYKGRQIVKVVVNGEVVKSTVPGQLIDNSTMLPLRAIAESLGASVTWDGKKAQASITTTKTPAQPVETGQPETSGLSLAELNTIGNAVGIVYAYDSANKFLGSGSGFVVGGSTFVTNAHVAKNATSLRVDFGEQTTTVQVKDALFKNDIQDLIGVKITGQPGLKISSTQPKQNDPVYALGFPHRRFTISDGKITNILDQSGTIQHTAETDGGSSGGCLINEDGEVIGITNGGVDGTDWNYAIQSKYLQDELNKIK